MAIGEFQLSIPNRKRGKPHWMCNDMFQRNFRKTLYLIFPEEFRKLTTNFTKPPKRPLR